MNHMLTIFPSPHRAPHPQLASPPFTSTCCLPCSPALDIPAMPPSAIDLYCCHPPCRYQPTMPSPPAIPSLSIVPLPPAMPIIPAMYCLTRLRSHNACLAMYQIRRTANAALKASTPSWRHRERGYGSSSRARSRSPPRSKPTRKHRRSCSPKYESRSLSDRVEKHS